jgi:hypothetical protein
MAFPYTSKSYIFLIFFILLMVSLPLFSDLFADYLRSGISSVLFSSNVGFLVIFMPLPLLL